MRRILVIAFVLAAASLAGFAFVRGSLAPAEARSAVRALCERPRPACGNVRAPFRGALGSRTRAAAALAAELSR